MFLLDVFHTRVHDDSGKVVTDVYFSFECVDFFLLYLRFIFNVKFIEISVQMK